MQLQELPFLHAQICVSSGDCVLTVNADFKHPRSEGGGNPLYSCRASAAETANHTCSTFLSYYYVNLENLTWKRLVKGTRIDSLWACPHPPLRLPATSAPGSSLPPEPGRLAVASGPCCQTHTGQHLDGPDKQGLNLQSKSDLAFFCDECVLMSTGGLKEIGFDTSGTFCRHRTSRSTASRGANEFLNPLKCYCMHVLFSMLI